MRRSYAHILITFNGSELALITAVNMPLVYLSTFSPDAKYIEIYCSISLGFIVLKRKLRKSREPMHAYFFFLFSFCSRSHFNRSGHPQQAAFSLADRWHILQGLSMVHSFNSINGGKDLHLAWQYSEGIG